MGVDGRLNEGDVFILGRAPECDLVVDAPQVSGRHLRIAVVQGAFHVEDLGSSNGLYVDGQRVERAKVDSASLIGLGTHVLTMSQILAMAQAKRPAADRGPAGAVAGQQGGPVEVRRVGPDMLTLGRDAGCDVRIDDSAVSGRHARVFRSAGRLILEDLGSRNGSFVQRGGQGDWDSVRSAVLRPQDRVRIGPRVFQFVRAESERAANAGACLEVRGATLRVRDRETGAPRNILNQVTLAAFPGEIVGIMGPSGSGKTSLLSVLAGFVAPDAGEVRLDGVSLYEGQTLRAGMGPLIGFAPQFDVAHELLTVRDAVRSSAQLRGSVAWTPAELDERVQRALVDVGMEKHAGTLMGSDTRKTLSGGQKKRVNIAMELVLDPPVLLLDEPSSGLSAQDTLELMRLLRRLADQGRTVVLTIHQPSYGVYVQMDQVLILEEGGFVAWFGPTAQASFEFFDVNDRDPGTLMERLPRKASAEAPGLWATTFAQNEGRRDFMRLRAESASAARPGPTPPRPGVVRQTGTLLARALRLKARDRFFVLLSVVVPAVISFVIGKVLAAKLTASATWSPERAEVEHQFLVVMTMMVCFFGALCSSLEIVTELPIVRREKRGGVGLLPYVASKAILYGLPSLTFPLISLAAFSLAAPEVLEGEYLRYAGVLVPAYFAATCAGLFISAWLASTAGVIILAVFYALVQVVFSTFMPLNVTFGENARAEWLRSVSAPVGARWTLAGLVGVSDLCTEAGNASAPPDGVSAFVAKCRPQFYQNYAVDPAETPDQREAPVQRKRALIVNLMMALASLALAGALLTRRVRAQT